MYNLKIFKPILFSILEDTLKHHIIIKIFITKFGKKGGFKAALKLLR